MLPLRIAWRYLLAKKTHAAVNIISLISMVGVAVATAAIVIVLSVFNGFSDLALGHLSVIDPQVKVLPVSGKAISNGDSVAAVVGRLECIESASPVIDERGLMVYGGHQMPVVFKGVGHGYSRISDIDRCVVDGGFTDSAYNMPCALVCVGVAYNIDVHPGQDVALYVPRRQGRINTAYPATAFRADSLLVSGVFRVDQPEYDTDRIIIPLDVARRLLLYDHEASSIDIRIREGWDIGEAIQEIKSVVGDSYKVQDRLQQQEASFRMISIEKWVTFMMLAFILLVSSFNIISTLSMLVLEKRDNLLTLRAVGASESMVRRIFICLGWLISAIGGMVGILVGVCLSLAQQYGGFIHLSADPASLTITAYPVRVDFMDLITVVIVVVIIGFITSQITSMFIRGQLRDRT